MRLTRGLILDKVIHFAQDRLPRHSRIPGEVGFAWRRGEGTILLTMRLEEGPDGGGFRMSDVEAIRAYAESLSGDRMCVKVEVRGGVGCTQEMIEPLELRPAPCCSCACFGNTWFCG